MQGIKKICFEILGIANALLLFFLLLEFYMLSLLIIFSQSIFSVLFIYYATTLGGLVIYRTKNGPNNTWHWMLRIYALLNHLILVFCFPGTVTTTLCDIFSLCY